MGSNNIQGLGAGLDEFVARTDPETRQQIMDQLDELDRLERVEKCRDDFLSFCKAMWPIFIESAHHRQMAKVFEGVVKGTKKRAIINIRPRVGKSELTSWLLPAWFIGKFPTKKIMQVTHTASLATKYGKRVRDLISTPQYQEIFPGVKLKADSKAAGKWETQQGGEYFAAGTDTNLAGWGADLCIIDDPISEQDGKTGNKDVFDKNYDWYTSGPRQRLQPGGTILVVMCMTGDTDVLRPDGSTTKLCDLCPGDEVSSYEDGKIVSSRVLNFRSNGDDAVFTVQTRSGITLRANERHPFLVDFDGERKWTLLRDLRPGMRLVSVRDATVCRDLEPNQDCVTHARQEPRTTGKTQPLRSATLAITASGVVGNVNVVGQSGPPVNARPATNEGVNIRQKRRRNTGLGASSTDTGSRACNTTKWSPHVQACVTAVGSRQAARIQERTGAASCALTTATIQAKSEGCFATTATSPSDTGKHQKYLSGPRIIYDVTLDPIVAVTASGRDEVFDIEVERTGNFIANGIVSHNTRWHKMDLTGRLIKSSVESPGADQWELITFPAILPSGTQIFPELWPLDQVLGAKASMSVGQWNAQFMQNPTSEEGALIKREWWQRWEKEKEPECYSTIMSWDTAFGEKQRDNYSAMTLWGVFNSGTEDKPVPNMMMLDAWRGRVTFPDLKKNVIKQWEERKPDVFLVENRATGAPLIYELRAMGIPVSEFNSSWATGDKTARANSVTDLFRSGMVWAPTHRWAEEVVEECAEFPFGEYDDYVDTVVQALMRFRKGGYIRVPTDYEEPEEKRVRLRHKYYW